MIPPVGMALAATTVMLWIIWSDTLRSRRPMPILYALRVALFLIVSLLMIVDLVRYPGKFSGSAMPFAILAIAVGLFGAGYFVRKLIRRR